MIKIKTRDGKEHLYSDKHYTSYEVNYGLLIVKHEEQWIGIYPIDYIMYADIDPEVMYERDNFTVHWQ